jgi:carbon-monoxide dehydrogenase medium subunit
MLLNLKTIHRPATVEEAAALVQQPGTYPLYGGAALQRNPRPEVEAAVDLSRLGLDYVRDSENSLRLGSMLTLEQARQACLERAAPHPRIGGIAAMLKEEMPETLRNTFTLGDLLVERDPQSPTLTLFLALGAILKRIDVDLHFTMSAWLAAEQDVARYLLAHVRVTRGPQRAAVAYEKVSRTPADKPIVGAVACAEAVGDSELCRTALALCGVAPTPIPQPEVARVRDETGDLDAALDRLDLDPPGDHWGSREYRVEMARVVARRALARAVEEARGG